MVNQQRTLLHKINILNKMVRHIISLWEGIYPLYPANSMFYRPNSPWYHAQELDLTNFGFYDRRGLLACKAKAHLD